MTTSNAQNNNIVSPLTSQALSLLRWPMAMFIVAVHWFSYDIFPTADIAAEEIADSYTFTNTFCAFIKAFISENGVATFFFISGYLFFVGGEMTSERYKAKIHRRLHSLLIPYLLWNLIAVAALAIPFLPILQPYFPRLNELGWNMSRLDFFTGFFYNPTTGFVHNQPLWFIRDLMLCVLLVPLLKGLVKRYGRQMLIIIGISYACFFCFGNITIANQFGAIFFFYWGGLIGSKNRDLMQVMKGKGVVAATAYIIAGAIYMAVFEEYPELASAVKIIGMLSLIIMAVNIVGRLVEKYDLKANKFLTRATFFCFAFHAIIYGRLQRAMMLIVHPQSDAALFITVFIGYFLLFAIILGVFWVLEKCLPNVAAILIGRRKYNQTR